MFSYETLEIWQLAIQYAKHVYEVTRRFPINEKYNLVSQLQRAGVSVSANIAEGSGATSLNDRLHYLDIAIKSCLETTSEIQIAYELGYLSKEQRDVLYGRAEMLIKRIRAFKKFLKNH